MGVRRLYRTNSDGCSVAGVDRSLGPVGDKEEVERKASFSRNSLSDRRSRRSLHNIDELLLSHPRCQELFSKLDRPAFRALPGQQNRDRSSFQQVLRGSAKKDLKHPRMPVGVYDQQNGNQAWWRAQSAHGHTFALRRHFFCLCPGAMPSEVGDHRRCVCPAPRMSLPGR